MKTALQFVTPADLIKDPRDVATLPGCVSTVDDVSPPLRAQTRITSSTVAGVAATLTFMTHLSSATMLVAGPVTVSANGTRPSGSMTISGRAASTNEAASGPIITGPPPKSWLATTTHKLHALMGLHRDWDKTGPEPPSDLAISAAIGALNVLHGMGLEPSRVLPSADGGIGVCFYHEERYVSVEFLNTGEIIGLRKVPGEDTPHIWDLDPSNLSAEFQSIGTFVRG